MNRRLIDPFQSVRLPEIIEEYLDHGTATCIAFNRRGTLLAAGTQQGQVVIWDFDTRGVARVYTGHSAPVTSVCWSRNGKYLASGSTDQQLILWDVAQGVQALQVPLPAPVTHVSLSPRQPWRCAVSLASGPPLLVDLESNAEPVQVPLVTLGADGDAPAAGKGPSAVVKFSSSGDMLFVGHAKGGLISVLDVPSLSYLDIVKLPGSVRVTGLKLNRKGSLLLANCHDRVVRMFEVAPRASFGSGAGGESAVPLEQGAAMARLMERGSLENKAIKGGSLLWDAPAVLTSGLEFQNAVERMLWADVCFSADSEYVLACMASKTQHIMYVWNRVLGNMERILEGPKEGGLAVAWHPTRSCLVSLTTTGRVLVWSLVYTENWSAFAPDFKELEENADYVEREDEFDWATPGASGHIDSLRAQEQGKGGAGAGEGAGPGVNVDVLGLEDEGWFSSDDDEDQEESLHHLPAEIVPEELPPVAAPPEDGEGGVKLEVGQGADAAGDGAMKQEGGIKLDGDGAAGFAGVKVDGVVVKGEDGVSGSGVVGVGGHADGQDGTGHVDKAPRLV